MTFGLPTIILNKIKCVIQADNLGIFPYVANSLEEMANTIMDLFSDEQKYERASKKGKDLSSLLSLANTEMIIRKKYKEVFASGGLQNCK